MKLPELHVTVAASPQSEIGSPKILLEHDIRMAKAGILYADKIQLCSVVAWMAMNYYAMGEVPVTERERLHFVWGLVDTLAPYHPELSEKVPQLKRLSQLTTRKPILLTRKEKQTVARLKPELLNMWDDLRAKFVEVAKNAGVEELFTAAHAGILELRPFKLVDMDEFAMEYFEIVSEVLKTGDSYPMLDENTAGLVSAALKEGKLDLDSRVVRRGRQSGIVAELFDQLPVLDMPMDELLDVRSELNRPLVSFRSHIMDLEKEVESAVWDANFADDVKELYRKRIAPSLLEIEELIKGLGLEIYWRKRINEKPGAVGLTATVAMLAVAISPMVGLGVAFAGLHNFVKVGEADRMAEFEKLDRNGLYFYYKLKNIA